ncbi:MAG: adenosylcobalamin-dependent ribonucleoside-diphosphate reductase [Candidatus Paceibacterota bacterium]
MTSEIEKIKKRDGRVVNFNSSKIADAIYGSMTDVGMTDYEVAEELATEVVDLLEKEKDSEELLTVEQAQDVVEEILIKADQAEVAKAFILYRQERKEIRNKKKQILEKEEIDQVDKTFDANALRVLKSRYLKKDEEGNLIESPAEMFERVAVHVALPSIFYDPKVFEKGGDYDFSTENLKVEEELKVGDYALNDSHVEGLRRLYRRLEEEGKVKKSWEDFLSLLKQGEFDEYQKEIEAYYELMTERKFLPNTPALVNFGRELSMGLACFVLPMEDSLDSIMEGLKKASLIFKSGGGVGYNFSRLRPEGDYISSTGGESSGPISFMTLFDKMTDVVKQGGIRRGASMGIMNSDHPDVEKFITAKKNNEKLNNFNLSVFIKEDFWDYYEKGEPYPLENPRTGEVSKKVDPEALFDLIVHQGWESAEPGVIFDDNVNEYNPFRDSLGRVDTCNPCGESVLYPNESCDLGAINVWAFIEEDGKNGEREVEVDWEGMKKAIRLGTRFLDNVLDINKYPLEDIEEMSRATRKIGLGMMGLGNFLYELGLPYNSEEGREKMEEVMEFINYYSKVESISLAKNRGKFPYYDKSFFGEGKLPLAGYEEENNQNLNWDLLVNKIQEHGLRNAYTTIIAPTGSTSMIAGTSSGMEPVYSLVYEKKVSVGSFYYVNPVFEKVMEREGLFDDDLVKNISDREGSCQNINYIPPRFKDRFITAMDISGENHVKALASIQKWVDSSVSKTINFPADASPSEMKRAYLLAHDLGCKDVTVFRNKSMQGVLEAGGEDKEEKDSGEELESLKDDKSNGRSVYSEAGVNENQGSIGQDFNEDDEEKCPECNSELKISEGCKTCPNCGWSACSVS